MDMDNNPHATVPAGNGMAGAATQRAEQLAQRLRRALLIANDAVIADIECNAHQHIDSDGRTWWDIRPMLDPHEHAPQSIDMAAMAIDYAIDSALAQRHPFERHLLRLTCRNL